MKLLHIMEQLWPLLCTAGAGHATGELCLPVQGAGQAGGKLHGLAQEHRDHSEVRVTRQARHYIILVPGQEFLTSVTPDPSHPPAR